MKTMLSIIKYDFAVYLKSAKSLMPLVIFLAFLGALYAYKPANPISGFNLTMTVLFFIMVWVGLSQTDLENPVSEQLMILKVQSAVQYYSGNLIFLFILCLLYGAIAVLAPLVANITQSSTLFAYPVSPADVANAFLLNCLAGYAGCALGSLLHPRIIKDRKLAAILAFAVAIIGLVKQGILAEFPAGRFFTWIFPPISEVNSMLGNAEYYDSRVVPTCLLFLAVYALAISVIKIVLLVRKKF